MSEIKKLKFPEGFLWGAANSAYQVEGGVTNNWSEWEGENAERLAEDAKTYWQAWQREKFPEMLKPENYISGLACDHYHRYAEDFDLAKSLNHNAHRLSLEWSRIESEEGKFDAQEIEHYRQVLLALKARGMKTCVTLWHWTHPLWVEKAGDIASPNFSKCFSRYAAEMVKQLGDQVDLWVTMNEPSVVVFNAYGRGIWPPQKKGYLVAFKAFQNLIKAHRDAYDVMHAVKVDAMVGVSHNLNNYEPKGNNMFDKFIADALSFFGNEYFISSTQSKHDFIGLQYYFHRVVSFPLKFSHFSDDLTDMGWEIYPKGIYNLLKQLKKYNKPIFITENGLADAKDEKRAKFIKEHLQWVHQAITEGVDVKGYFYWSLLDNFEWDKGFWPQFGLVEIDRKTLERRLRPSALEYAKICKKNAVEVEE